MQKWYFSYPWYCENWKIGPTIYSFRYAHPGGILEFDDEHPGTHDANLVECRRCPTLVVEIADALIRHNHPPEVQDRLQPLEGNPNGEVHIVQWSSVEHELDGLARYVNSLITECDYNPGDIIVLTPRKLFGYGIRDALKNLRVDAHSFYNEEPLDDANAQEAFTLLTLLSDNEDRVALRWWLGYGSPSWRRSQYAKLRTYCEKNDISPWETLELLTSGDLNISGVGQLQERFEELQPRLEVLHELTPNELFDELFPADADWSTAMREFVVDNFPEGEGNAANALLEHLRGNIIQPEIPEQGDFVRVMSLHKSKGSRYG